MLNLKYPQQSYLSDNLVYAVEGIYLKLLQRIAFW